MRLFFIAFSALCFLVITRCEKTVQLRLNPWGRKNLLNTRVLEKGAELMQNNSPLHPMTIYLVGFQAVKQDPSHWI